MMAGGSNCLVVRRQRRTRREKQTSDKKRTSWPGLATDAKGTTANYAGTWMDGCSATLIIEQESNPAHR
jgi:hypothetical protein